MQKDEAPRSAQFIIHAALDMVDIKQWTSPSMCAAACHCIVTKNVPTLCEGMLSPYAHVRMPKAWLAARVSLRLARMSRPALARRSWRHRATLAPVPVLFALTVV